MNSVSSPSRTDRDDVLAELVGCAVHRRRLYVDDMSLHYLEAGAGRPVLLLHGLNMGWGQWYQNIADLVAAGCHVFALDLPGSGRSDDLPAGTPFVAGQVAAVRSFIRQLDLTDVTVVGHSLGAVIGLALAQDPAGFVRALVLEGPLGFTGYIPPAQRPATVRPLARVLARTILGPGYQGLRRFLESSMFEPQNLPAPFVAYYAGAVQARPHSHPLEVMSRLSRRLGMRPELVVDGQLSRVSVPVLLLIGAHDHIVPAERVARVAHKLPHARLEVLLGSGHVPNLEHPREFDRRVEHFIAAGGV